MIDSADVDIQNQVMTSVLEMVKRHKSAEQDKVMRLGREVKFDAKTRGVIKGTIEKINTKTVKVRATTGMLWTVSKNLIETV